MNSDVFNIEFPREENGLDQDEEFCILINDGCRQKVRFHDYHKIYEIEGLYEHLFYDVLKCNSPKTVCAKVLEVVEETDLQPEDLKVLDIGAGNGMVGEELKGIGADTVIGIDIIPEAREAQLRDRPEIYEDYLVQDLTSLDPAVKRELEGLELNCMTTVAALGFGDIPPKAFAEGYNLIEENGIVAFNIRDKFIEEKCTSGFSELIDAISSENILDVHFKNKYRHRLDVDGNPIHYYVIAGVKNEDIPRELVKRFV